MVNGVMANGVSVIVRKSVFEVVVDGSSSSLGQVASASVRQLDKERLLDWFNQERVTVQRRRERIRRLEGLGNCQDAAATIRFWEQI
ncbi:hypothetical protein Tco_1304338 [Tanacetum coccineum]